MSAAPILEAEDVDEAALLAAALADVAGDEAAVIGRLSELTEATGFDDTRAALVRLAVVMFARWLTPHTPGATVPVSIPTPTEGASS